LTELTLLSQDLNVPFILASNDLYIPVNGSLTQFRSWSKQQLKFSLPFISFFFLLIIGTSYVTLKTLLGHDTKNLSTSMKERIYFARLRYSVMIILTLNQSQQSSPGLWIHTFSISCNRSLELSKCWSWSSFSQKRTINIVYSIV
jgi:hypothetical protein